MGIVAIDRQEQALWEREWMHHHLRLAMQTLRATFEPRSLDVFGRLMDGDPIDHVAAAFGMTTDAVHKVKQRVRRRLRELVAAQCRQEDDPDGRNAN